MTATMILAAACVSIGGFALGVGVACEDPRLLITGALCVSTGAFGAIIA